MLSYTAVYTHILTPYSHLHISICTYTFTHSQALTCAQSQTHNPRVHTHAYARSCQGWRARWLPWAARPWRQEPEAPFLRRAGPPEPSIRGTRATGHSCHVACMGVLSQGQSSLPWYRCAPPDPAESKQEGSGPAPWPQCTFRSPWPICNPGPAVCPCGRRPDGFPQAWQRGDVCFARRRRRRPPAGPLISARKAVKFRPLCACGRT